MRTTQLLIDLLFPPRKSECIIRNADSIPRRLKYERQVISLSEFAHPIANAAITENKFYANRKATRLLGELLAHWIDKQPTSLICIPVPLSKKRLKERGYNQVAAVLEEAANIATVQIQNDVLKRVRDTTPQTTLLKAARLKNVQHAFAVTTTAGVPSTATVVLLDDVLTTGATLESAYATLRPHLPKHQPILRVALAH